MSNKTDVSIVYISKTKNSSFFKTFLMKKHGVAVLFDFESELSPFLTCLDFGVCKAIRLVRFGYNTFTGCVV